MTTRGEIVLLLILIWLLKTHSYPKACRINSSLLTCTRTKRLNLKKLAKELAFNSIAEYVVLESKKSQCGCDTSKLAKILSQEDILVFTPSKCEWKSIKPCLKGTNLQKPIMASGLVISKDDTKLKWAIKHHVVSLWSTIRLLSDSTTRDRILQGIITDLMKIIFNHRKDKKSQTLLKLMLEKNDADVEIHQEAVRPDEDYVKEVTDDLDIVQNKQTNEDLKNRSSAPDLDFLNEDDLEYNLEKDLTAIQKYLKSNLKHRKKTKWRRDTSFLNRSKSQRSLSKHRFRKAVQVKAPLFPFPFKLFADGEYVNLYNTFAVQTALSRERAFLSLSDQDSEETNQNGRSLDDEQAPPLIASLLSSDSTDYEFLDGDDETATLNRTNITRKFITAAGHLINAAQSIGLSPKEYDHRIKSLVVFFVAIVGVIIVLSVLIMMAVQGGSKAKPIEDICYVDQDKRLRCMKDAERKMDEKKTIYPVYEGADFDEIVPGHDVRPSYLENPEKSHYQASTSQYRPDQRPASSLHKPPGSTLESPHSNTLKRFETNEQMKAENNNNPASKMNDLRLGGRHLVVDFAKTIREKKSKIQDKSLEGKPSSINLASSKIQNVGLRGINSSDAEDSNHSHTSQRPTTLVSFLNSIDNGNDGILRYDHRSSNTWMKR